MLIALRIEEQQRTNVDQLDPVRAIDEHISRMQRAVHQPRRMKVLDGVDQLASQLECKKSAVAFIQMKNRWFDANPGIVGKAVTGISAFV